MICIKIKISKKDLQFIKKEMDLNSPYEACGVLIGRMENNIAIVEQTIPMENTKKSSSRFEIDAEQLYKIWDFADKNNKEIVGIYHSHPFSLAVPSLVDRPYMEYNPYPWLIIGIDGLKGYLLDNNNKIKKIIIQEI